MPDKKYAAANIFILPQSDMIYKITNCLGWQDFILLMTVKEYSVLDMLSKHWCLVKAWKVE